jgi:class 3 adenylate cyclase
VGIDVGLDVGIDAGIGTAGGSGVGGGVVPCAPSDLDGVIGRAVAIARRVSGTTRRIGGSILVAM